MIQEKYQILKKLTMLEEGADRTALIEALLADEPEAEIKAGTNILFPDKGNKIVGTVRDINILSVIREFLTTTPIALLSELRRKGDFSAHMYGLLDSGYMGEPIPDNYPARTIITFNDPFPDIIVWEKKVSEIPEEEKKPTTIEKGDIVVATSGSYSDYSILGTFRARKALDVEKARMDWVTLHPEQIRHSFDEDAFLAYLFENYLEDVDWREMYVGEYD